MYKKPPLVKIFLCCFLLLYGLRLTAQTDTEFWFVIPEVTLHHQQPGGVPASFRFSSGTLPATVTISMPANQANFPDIVIDMPANSFHIEDLSCWIVTPCNPPFNPGGGYTDLDLLENKPYNASGINNLGIRITATTPITAYYEISRTNNKDIWALKGKNGLGRGFLVPFQTDRNNQNIAATQPYSAIDVVATADNTVISFTLPPGIRASYGAPRTDLAPGSTFSRTLNRGQTFSLFPLNFSRNAGDRLRGTRITSNRDIAVVVNDDSFFHTAGGCYDIAGDQIIPIGIVGTEYIVIRTDLYRPVTPRTNQHDHIYILATQNGTQITVYNPDSTIPATTQPGNVPNPITINARQQHYVRLPHPLEFYRIVASEPVYVWHVGGFGCEVGGAILPPIDQCTGVPKVSFARTSTETFYMIMMVRKGAENDFRFMVQTAPGSGVFEDRTFLLGAGFIEVIDSEWSVRRFGPFTTAQVPETNHYMENSEDIFHLGIVNGGSSSGCFYGYFSDFNVFNPGTFVVESGSPGGKICSGESRQLFASGGTKYKWTPNDFLDDDEIATPYASDITYSVDYTVEVSGACNKSAERQVQIRVGGPCYPDFESDIFEGCATKADPADDPALTVNFTNLSDGDYYRKWYYRLGEGGTNTLFASGDDGGGDPADEVSFDFPNTTGDTLRYYVTLLVQDVTQNCTRTIERSILVYPYIDVNPTRTLLDANGCHPLDVELRANAVGNFGGAYFNWEFGDGGSNNNPNPTHTFNNFSDDPVTFTPTITLTDQFNYCSVTKNVSVTVQPYIKASFVVDKPEGCTPLNVNVINDSKGGITSYQWDRNGDGIYEHTGGGNWTLEYLNTNTNNTQRVVPVSLRVSNAGGCTDVFTRNVTINPRATSTISLTSPAGTDTRCSPLPINLSSTTTNATTFNWFSDGVGISNEANTPFSFENNGADPVDKTVTFIASNQWGCAAPTQTEIVTVNPFVEAIISLNTEEGCTPLDVQFTNASSLGSSFIEWSIDGTVFADPNSQSPFINSTVTNTVLEVDVVLIAQNSAGCQDDDSRTIKVNPRAIADFTFDLEDEHGNPIDPNGPLCSPVHAQFFGQTTNATTFNWQFGDLGASVEENPEFILRNLTDVVRPVLVELNANNQYNCPSLPATQNFDIRPEIRANFSLSNSIGCAPLTFIVDAPPTSGVYEWDYNGDLYSGSYHEFTITENKTGETQYYEISLTATDNDGICVAQSDTRVITVYPEVEAKWNLDDDLPPNCSPYSFSITNESTLYNSSTTLTDILWQITDGAGYNTSSTNPTITRDLYNDSFENTKDYSVTLTATSSDGCQDTKTADVTVWPKVVSAFTVDFIERCTPMEILVNDASLAMTGSTYTWDFDGGEETNIGGEDYQVIYNNDDPDEPLPVWINLEVENSYGCTDGYDFLFDVLPVVNASFELDSGSERYHCGAGGVTFVNTSSGGNINYFWEFGDGQSFAATTNQSVTHPYDNATSVDVDYTVTLTAKNIYECEDDYEQLITVHPRVDALYSYTIPDICAYPLEVNFHNASAYSTAQSGVETTFQWDYGYQWEGEDQTDTFSETDPLEHSYSFYNPLSDELGVYDVSLTTNQTHEISGLTCPGVHTKTINVYPELIADFDLPVEWGCNPLTVSFVDGSSGVLPSQGGSYWWDFGDGTGSNLQTPENKVYAHADKTSSKYYPIELTISNPEGCKKIASGTVEVYPLVESAFTVDRIEGCTPIDVLVNNTSTSSAYVYEWAFEDGQPANSNQEQPGMVSFVNSTAPPKDIEVINPVIWLQTSLNRQEYNLRCPENHQIELTVYPHIYPNFTGDLEGCNPLNVSLTNTTGAFGGVSNASYNWTLGNGLTTTNINPSQIYNNTSFTDDATYTVRLDATSEHGCTDFIERVVTVYPKPKAQMELLGEYIDCPPFEVDIENLSLAPNATTFTYDFGDGSDPLISGSDIVSHTFNNSHSDEVVPYMITLFAETDRGCEDFTTQTVYVLPEVRANFDFDPGSAACNPFIVTMVNNTENAYYYHWDFDDNGLTSNSHSPTHRFVNSTARDREFRVTLTALSEYDCEDTYDLPLTVYAAPIADFAVSPPLQVFPDATFQIINQSDPAAPEWSYTWDFGDGYGSNEMHPGEKTYEYWGPIEDDFRYLITLDIENEHCSDYTERYVTLRPAEPESMFEARDGIYEDCSPLIVYFVNNSIYGHTFEWDFGYLDENGNPVTSNEFEPVHVFVEPGYYNVRLTVYGDGGVKNYFRVLRVYENPEADFRVAPERVLLPDARVHIFNLSKRAETYIWDLGDGTVSTDRDPVHTYMELGEYRIHLTAYTEYGCMDSTSKNPAVWVEGVGRIRFPNAFVPSKLGPSGGYYDAVDYKNEVFHPVADGVVEYRLMIFNRWGEQIFESNDIKIGWDGYYQGKLLSQDVYVWRAIGKFSNGKLFDKRGNVTLLR